VSCAVLLGLAAPTARALELQIDNQSGKPDSDVYVMLFGAGAFNASFLQNNVPVKLSTVPEVNGTRQIEVDQLVAGRLYVSYGAGVNVAVPLHSPTRFDWTEFTVTPSPSDVANLTRVDMFGIPMRLDTLDASGNVLETLSEAHADAIFDALRAIPGGRSAVVRGANKEIVRILSPTRADDYPNLAH
jgi:glycosyl hydrolase family 64 (putative beta-1,3-glucanase)